ncbi:thioredoxin [Coprinopsis sp. MPI-PUGE-AT-0042]|nr:thioredoxin [Coprinopsis sp. MPI-PUGE-AT-0042]
MSTDEGNPVPYIKSKEEFDQLINGDRPVVIDFTATWCSPCNMIAPVFRAMSNEAPGQGIDMGFYKVDIDEHADLAQPYGISTIPTFMLFQNGQRIKEPLKGANPDGLTALTGVQLNK